MTLSNMSKFQAGIHYFVAHVPNFRLAIPRDAAVRSPARPREAQVVRGPFPSRPRSAQAQVRRAAIWQW